MQKKWIKQPKFNRALSKSTAKIKKELSMTPTFFPVVKPSDADLNASSNGFFASSLNNPISSQFFRNLVGVGV